MQQVRLDKWLWAARFYKTRSLAKQAIDGGKVHYNGAKTRASKLVEVDAVLRFRQGWDEKTVVVKALSDQRRGAPEARLLYDETGESIAKREQEAAMRRAGQAQMAPDSRPNKKQRRDIIRFRNDQDQSK